jgi:uncharacterized membrane protein
LPARTANQQRNKNRDRFPADFVFQINTREKKEVVTNCHHLANLKFSPRLPYAFTEHGAIMAATILNSPRAVEVSIFVVRAFVKLRQFVLSQKELTAKLLDLERKVGAHDNSIRELISAIRQLMALPASPAKKGRIGFHAG